MYNRCAQYRPQLVVMYSPPLLMLIKSSVIPWVLPAEERWAVLLRAVHQLPLLALCHLQPGRFTYEEPHRRAEAGGHESV